MTETSSAQDFLYKWDFDADGINDTITYKYSGGAHCCYQIKIWTSQKNKVWDFSHYEMDGGYVMGLDNSQPHFQIRNFDNDSAPEIFLASGTYNGDYSLSQEVLLDYMNGVFVALPFDIYEHERSKKVIKCSGKKGFTGYYIAMEGDAINNLLIHKDSDANYHSRPRGVGGWEINYKGKWVIKNNELTITFDSQYYLDSPDDQEKLKDPIIYKFIFSEEDCILKQQCSNSELFYYKE